MLIARRICLAAFFALACVFQAAGLFVASAAAAEPVRLEDNESAIDLTGAIEIFRERGPSFQVSAAPGADGIVRRIEIRAVSPAPTGNWAVFTMSNPTDRQIDRLLVAPHFRLAGSGIIWPDLGSERIVNITPSEGFALDRAQADSADVFNVTLDPGATVTFVIEMASQRLPQVQIWAPDAYESTQNAFTLYKGVVLGISALLSLFLAIVFFVRGTALFPATTALAVAVFMYVAIDFGFLNRIIAIAPGSEPVWRAGVEVVLAAILVLFVFVYLSLNRWNRHLSMLTAGWIVALAVLAFVAVVNPSIAAGIARFSFAGTVVLGVPLIVVLGLQGYDRAVMLVPTWILMLAWLLASWLAVTGQIDNPVIQPALSGGMVLIVLLLGFTVMQHAFAAGVVEEGLFSDVERKALALTGSGDVVWDWDLLRDRIATVPDLSEKLGFKAGTLTDSPAGWLSHIHGEDRERFRTTLDAIVDHKRGRIADEFRLQTPSGRVHWYALRARPLVGNSDEVIRCIGTLTEITEQKTVEARLQRDSINDNLTGLPNRELFISALNSALKISEADGMKRPTVFCVDIDRYRFVNEAHGLHTGDTIILTLARRMQRLLKPQDAISRMMGDQFAIMLMSEQEPARVAAFADSVQKAISTPISHGGEAIELSASIGVAGATTQSTTADMLIKDAELAMHHAKRHGGNRIEPFRPAFRGSGTDRLQMETDLRRAVDRGEIEILYQPIIRLADNAIAGFEALLRWNHPRRGIISPTEFIPLAEETGIITRLGQYALNRSTTQLRKWQTELGEQPFFISVNLSSVQILRQDIVGDVKAALSQSGLKPKFLKLELTESVVMEDPERAVDLLARLKELSIGLSIDDFGTGHSSLAYLSKFPFDTIKIDRAFVVDEGPKRDTLLKALVTLGVDLGMTVIAEGVGNDDDAQVLRSLGCTYVQSFAFGEPRNAEHTMKMLRQQMQLERA
jgi:diguanylate cyclase (GGDEF)-like protein/PAS domain S-box-containing protein